MNDIGSIKSAFKEKREERQLEAPKAAELRDTLAETLTLSEIVRGIADVCEPYAADWFVTLGGFKVDPLNLQIQLPSPAFFFVEHGTPFVISALAEPPSVKYVRRRTAVEVYNEQVRTCCAAIRSPQLTVEEIKRLPPLFTQIVYGFVMDKIAPEPTVGLIRLLTKKAKEQETKLQLLELYLMGKSNQRQPIGYLFPNHAAMSPFVIDALEYILHGIGYEYEKQLFQTQIKAATAGRMRSMFG